MEAISRAERLGQPGCRGSLEPGHPLKRGKNRVPRTRMPQEISPAPWLYRNISLSTQAWHEGENSTPAQEDSIAISDRSISATDSIGGRLTFPTFWLSRVGNDLMMPAEGARQSATIDCRGRKVSRTIAAVYSLGLHSDNTGYSYPNYW